MEDPDSHIIVKWDNHQVLTVKVSKLAQLHSRWIELPVLMYLNWQCDSKIAAAPLNQISQVLEDSAVSTLKEMMMSILTSLMFLMSFSALLMPFPLMKMRNGLIFKIIIGITKKSAKRLLLSIAKQSQTILNLTGKSIYQRQVSRVVWPLSWKNQFQLELKESLQKSKKKERITQEQEWCGTCFTASLRHLLWFVHR